MELSTADIVIVGIILARLLVPLTIIRFPLPGIVACLVLDAVDQTVFQALAPGADLSGYQSYDKAPRWTPSSSSTTPTSTASKINDWATLGSGSSEPYGLATRATVGGTAAATATTTTGAGNNSYAWTTWST